MLGFFVCKIGAELALCELICLYERSVCRTYIAAAATFHAQINAKLTELGVEIEEETESDNEAES